jgi:maltooligosyltrehalose trehalohydrolase
LSVIGSDGGTRFEVWAPGAGAVELVAGERRLRMIAEPGGWHRVTTDALGAGDDYRFSLDGGESLPDPRSRRQPEGVLGASRVVDLEAYRWGDEGWRAPPLGSAVIYELHVGTFSPEGTFDGALGRLDALVDLGVTHVELMPVAAFSGSRGWGYDGVFPFAVHEPYGGPAGLQRFVDGCHARGIAVLLDVVYNHMGPEGNVLERFGPYFTDHYTTPWGKAINLDGPESDEVRRFVVDNALSWLRDYHIDGLRIDAIHAIVDTSATHILEEMAIRADELELELGRPLALIAESDLNDPRVVRPREVGGYGLDAQWSDDFHHALHAYLTGETQGYYADFGRLADVARALHTPFLYDGRHSRFRRRRHGRAPEGLPAWRFLGYAQNHDQVGNRAVGDRLVHRIGPELAEVVATVVLLAPWIPMLFQGEEWGASSPFQYFTSHEDAGLGEAVREGRRSEFSSFGWDPQEIPDPQAPETFERSRLRWDERERDPHSSLLDWHRRLIALRARRPELRHGRREAHAARCDEEQGWLTLRRGDVLLACNFDGEQPREVPAPPSDRGGWKVTLVSPSASERGPSIGASWPEAGLELPPASAVVAERERRG